MISIVFVCVAIEQKIDQDMGVLFLVVVFDRWNQTFFNLMCNTALERHWKLFPAYFHSFTNTN